MKDIKPAWKESVPHLEIDWIDVLGYREGSIKLTMWLQVRVITGPVLAEYDSQKYREFYSGCVKLSEERV